MTDPAEKSENNSENKSETQSEKKPVRKAEKKTVKAQKAEKNSGVDAVKKWLGLAAAVLSFCTAIYGLLHAQAARKARAADATEAMASGRLQESAGDYEHAWDSFQKASKLAAADGMISKLFFGGLTKQQEQAHGALEELAEKWVENAQAPDEEGLGAIGDRAIKELSADVETATGAHKADLLAHIGYAYYLKNRFGGDGAKAPASFYREAIAADPNNPYANAFWGHLITFTAGGSAAEAQQHFNTALASGREHALVRRLELSAFSNRSSDEITALWWQAVNDMHKAGEVLDGHITHEMAGKYYLASTNENDRKALYKAVPPDGHAELARFLLKSGGPGNDGLPVKVILAYSLEAAGKNAEALAAWQDVAAAVQGDATSYNTVAREALKRLGGAKAHS